MGAIESAYNELREFQVNFERFGAGGGGNGAGNQHSVLNSLIPECESERNNIKIFFSFSIFHIFLNKLPQFFNLL
jgi:hypothetical protein